MNRVLLFACRATALALASAAFVPAASAAEIMLDATIDAVTVHPSGASVRRVADFSVPAGETSLVVSDLPTDLDPASLRIEGVGAGVSIASVSTEAVPATDASADPERSAIEAEIEALQDRSARLDDALAALSLRRKFADEMATRLPEGFGRSVPEEGGIAVWLRMSETLGAERAKIDAEAATLALEKRSLEGQIAGKRTALEELPMPRDHVAARIELSAEAAASGRLTISYRTSSARWQPGYDAALTLPEGAGAPTIAFVRRAIVAQQTGEDWNGVELTLSTSRPAEGSAAPELSTTLVDIWSPESQAAASRDRAMEPLAAMPAPKAADMAEAPVAEREAVVDFGEFRAEYRIPGRVTVASGVGERSLRIASETIEAQVEVRAVPRISDAAYLTARFAPAGAPVLPGRVSLTRDGMFVGTAEVELAEAGAELALGFGVDDRVAVHRDTLDRTGGERGIISSERTEERRYRITVENRHGRPMPIVVLDQLPVSENEDVAVRRGGEATPATEENVEGERGVLAWRYDYAPGEKREIRHDYVVTWPAELQVWWPE